MEQKDLDYFTDLFLKLKNKIQNDIHFEAENNNLYELNRGDELDQSQQETIKQLELKLIGRQTFLLKKIHYSLYKIHNGTFGTCEECGDDIPMNRLKARPIAQNCIQCKEKEERIEDHILYSKKSKTQGQAFKNVIPLYNNNFKTVM